MERSSLQRDSSYLVCICGYTDTDTDSSGLY